LRDLKIAYKTFGTLSANKDNAILFPSWYSGTSKILEQAYLGEGRALDPKKYFIILANQIGNGLSSSPQNTPAPFNASRFPHIDIEDDVRAQHKLVTEKFGISKLQLVLGGSMGAQQTYEWAVRFPDVVERAAPIAGTARATAHNRLLVETFMDAITSDPHWDGGWYRDRSEVHRGLRRHARIFAASGFTPKLYNEEGWRGLGFTTPEDFLVGFVEGYFAPMDPNNLLLMLSKWRNGDVSRSTGGDLKTALSNIKSKVSVIAIKEDCFFPLEDIKAEQELIPGSELKVISSAGGHLALFGFDPGYNAAIDSHLNELLAK
jgi:homoserine O-acetyltransferase